MDVKTVKRVSNLYEKIKRYDEAIERIENKSGSPFEAAAVELQPKVQVILRVTDTYHHEYDITDAIPDIKTRLQKQLAKLKEELEAI